MDGVAKAFRNKALVSAGVALLYGASPVDVIPDLIPVLGLLDDAIVVPAFLVLAYAQWRKSKRVSAATPNAGATSSRVTILPPNGLPPHLR